MALAAQFPFLSLAGSLGDAIFWNSKTVEAKKDKTLGTKSKLGEKYSDNNSLITTLILEDFLPENPKIESEGSISTLSSLSGSLLNCYT